MRLKEDVANFKSIIKNLEAEKRQLEKQIEQLRMEERERVEVRLIQEREREVQDSVDADDGKSEIELKIM